MSSFSPTRIAALAGLATVTLAGALAVGAMIGSDPDSDNSTQILTGPSSSAESESRSLAVTPLSSTTTATSATIATTTTTTVSPTLPTIVGVEIAQVPSDGGRVLMTGAVLVGNVLHIVGTRYTTIDTAKSPGRNIIVSEARGYVAIARSGERVIALPDADTALVALAGPALPMWSAPRSAHHLAVFADVGVVTAGDNSAPELRRFDGPQLPTALFPTGSTNLDAIAAWGTASNGFIAYGASDGAVSVVRFGTPNPTTLRRRNEGCAVRGLAAGPDGRFFAAARADGTLSLWRTSDWADLFPTVGNAACTLRGDTANIDAHVTWAPQGSTLAMSIGPIIRLLRIEANGTLTPLAQELTAHSASVVSLAFSDNGQRLFSVDTGGAVYQWDTRGTDLR